MDINPLSSLALPEVDDTTGNADLGRDEFLTMLIAQLENQDPLNPQDATEFTAQLAQFSSLEQLVNIDAGIQDLQTGFGGGLEGLTSAAMLGREVLFEGNRFELGPDGAVTRPVFELEEDAQSVTIELRRDGEVVRELSIDGMPAGQHPVRDETFALLEPGVYEIQVRASNESGPQFVRSLIRGTVDAAVPLGGESQLSLGQIVTPYSSVREIRVAAEEDAS